VAAKFAWLGMTWLGFGLTARLSGGWEDGAHGNAAVSVETEASQHEDRSRSVHHDVYCIGLPTSRRGSAASTCRRIDQGCFGDSNC